ncbi:MAG TPA: hypothetical protein ENG87_01730 [Candidatus Pacearchaeota archaeon]|nr:hypothetical protein [Candidatus Pacearchaeota archaeon]
MNKKGQSAVGGLGMFMVIFITVIVGVVLFQTIAQNVGSSINTVSVDMNITTPANGGVYNFTNYRALSSVTITNATGGETIAAGNYTIANNQVVNGALATTLTVDDAEYASSLWNVAATGQPLTYIADSGGRAMASLIVIFFALLIAFVALEPTLRSGILEALGK